MSIHYYLSVVPESLIASMLTPVEFGSYLAVGTKKRTRGQAIFFGLSDLEGTPFRLKEAAQLCVPHPDGQPKHSVYVSVYRVLEQLPLSSIGSLYLVTPDGRVLEIPPTSNMPTFAGKYHLYQEICPVHPRIASTLDPVAFTRYLTSSESRIHLPKLCFVDLRLGELGTDPEHGGVRDLPYEAIEHLRDCLIQLRDNPKKHTKTVDRLHAQAFPYRTVRNGVFLGSADALVYYPFPSDEELQTTYYEWWRSASIMGDQQGI